MGVIPFIVTSNEVIKNDNITLSFDVATACALHDSLTWNIDDMIDNKGWPLSELKEFADYKHMIDVCNSLADFLVSKGIEAKRY